MLHSSAYLRTSPMASKAIQFQRQDAKTNLHRNGSSKALAHTTDNAAQTKPKLAETSSMHHQRVLSSQQMSQQQSLEVVQTLLLGSVGDVRSG
jgi:hypothetical protein